MGTQRRTTTILTITLLTTTGLATTVLALVPRLVELGALNDNGTINRSINNDSKMPCPDFIYCFIYWKPLS